MSSKSGKGLARIAERTEWTPRELAAAVAKIIRKRRKLWNQRAWFGREAGSVAAMRAALLEEEPQCGTTGCVAGWVTALSLPGTVQVATHGSFWGPEGTSLEGSASQFAKEKLGLNDSQAEWLFDPARTAGQVLFALDQVAAGRYWYAERGSSRTVTVEVSD